MLLNGLALNLDETSTMKFILNNSPHCALSSCCKEKYVEEIENTKFLDLHMYNHISW